MERQIYTIDDLRPLEETKLASATIGERGELVLLQQLSQYETALKALPEVSTLSETFCLQV